MRFQRADDVRPGGFAATLKRLRSEGPDAFSIEPVSHCGSYGCRVWVLTRRAAARAPGPPLAEGQVALQQLAFSGLPPLNHRHKPRLADTAF